jgi:hypothetical protein
MYKTKKLILLFVAFVCLFGIMYSVDIVAEPEEPVPSEECELFYIRKEETNKCIGTLKASSVYESDPYGRKVESMIIIPGI